MQHSMLAVVLIEADVVSAEPGWAGRSPNAVKVPRHPRVSDTIAALDGWDPRVSDTLTALDGWDPGESDTIAALDA